jgi:hypothetical protein
MVEFKKKNMKLLFAVTIISMITLTNFSFGQLTTFFVKPHDTDNAYSVSSDSNYVAINTFVAPLNKLLFYIGGTNSSPKRTTLFLKLAADLGYHVISITYPNSTAIQAACGASADVNCYTNFRQEVCYGTPLSAGISIDSLNSLNTRAIKLLHYLDATYPSHNWGQFIVNSSIVWDKVVTSGHSQGAGNALYFASINSIDRCIMFSGANDYSNFYSAPPNWISGSFATPKNKIYSFLHLQDDGVPYSSQIQVTQALGMWIGDDDSTSVDNLISPFNNSHLLYTNETPQIMLITPFHNATVIDDWTPLDNLNAPKFSTVWTYLLTSEISTTSVNKINLYNQEFYCYPNPARDVIKINNNGFSEFTATIYNSFGFSVKQLKIEKGENVLDILDLPDGLYLISNGVNTGKFLKE